MQGTLVQNLEFVVFDSNRACHKGAAALIYVLPPVFLPGLC